MRTTFILVSSLVAGLSCSGTFDSLPPPGDSLSRSGDTSGDSSVPGDEHFTGDVAAGDVFAGDSRVGDEATAGDVFAGDSRAGDEAMAGDPMVTSRCNPPPATVIDVSVADLKAAIDSGETIAIVDVREPNETASGIIEGALLLPYSSGVLASNHGDLPSDRPLYVHCRSGGRSAAATAFLVSNGHTCVHDVQLGMNAWTAAGYPTVAP